MSLGLDSLGYDLNQNVGEVDPTGWDKIQKNDAIQRVRNSNVSYNNNISGIKGSILYNTPEDYNPVTLRKGFGQDAGWSVREPYGNARRNDMTQEETVADDIKGIQGSKNYSTPKDAPSNTSPQTYSGNPWMQVAGGASSMLGNYLMQRADRRNRPKPVRLQRYVPQNVDYSESRRQTKEMAELDKANMLRAMKVMGAGYMANATNALTNADRAKYTAVAASMENEGNIKIGRASCRERVLRLV